MSLLRTAHTKLSHNLVLLLPTPEAAHITACDPPRSTKSLRLIVLLLSALKVKWGERKTDHKTRSTAHRWWRGSPPRLFVAAVSTEIS